MSSANRLWHKGTPIDQAILEFTVGTDPEVDLAIARWDALASAAHARGLSEIGRMTKEEARRLVIELGAIADQCDNGSFSIPLEMEDCHTVLEAKLTERLGDLGKRIHEGRSRNDQVMVALRLYLRWQVIEFSEGALEIAGVFFRRATELAGIPMPGYTHFQLAMPSSLGMWFGAFGESFLEIARDGLRLFERLDSNPLGAASGFGVPMGLRRDVTASLLGFSRVQRNPVFVQNTRGYYEIGFTEWLLDMGRFCEMFACDLMLYTTAEFGFFKLPLSMTTGSSIMPNKRNPDVVELIRGSTSKIRGALAELESIKTKLPSNYHRDYQLTKEPVVRSVANAEQLLRITTSLADAIEPDIERLSGAMADELYVTYALYQRVREGGVSFREAYRAVAEEFQNGTLDLSKTRDDFSCIEQELRKEREDAIGELARVKSRVSELREKIESVETSLFERTA